MITENTAGIYQIESLSNPEQFYIGSSYDLQGRQKQHLYSLKRGKHHTERMQAHCNEFGAEDLIFSVICHCEDDELATAEQYYINLFKPTFNSTNIVSRTKAVRYQEPYRYEPPILPKRTPITVMIIEPKRIKIDDNRFKIGSCFYYIE